MQKLKKKKKGPRASNPRITASFPLLDLSPPFSFLPRFSELQCNAVAHQHPAADETASRPRYRHLPRFPSRSIGAEGNTRESRLLSPDPPVVALLPLGVLHCDVCRAEHNNAAWSRYDDSFWRQIPGTCLGFKGIWQVRPPRDAASKYCSILSLCSLVCYNARR